MHKPETVMSVVKPGLQCSLLNYPVGLMGLQIITSMVSNKRKRKQTMETLSRDR